MEFSVDQRRKLACAISIGLIVSACASAPAPGTPEAAQVNKETAATESVVELPSWYTTPPNEADKEFATATLTSPDLQLAVDKSILQAKRLLADRMIGRLTSEAGLNRSELTEGNNAAIVSAYKSTIANVVNDAVVSGYRVRESKVIAQKGVYRAYVLLEYPLIQVRKKLSSTQAFADLEKAIAAAKAK